MMKTSELSIVAGILLVGAFTPTVFGFYDGENREIRCKGELVKNHAFHGNFKTCMHEFRDAKESVPEAERRKGHTCLAICALAKEGLFDEAGVYQEAKMMSKLDEDLPAHLAEILKGEVGKCVTEHKVAELKYTADDTVCKGYKKFLRCTAAGWMKTCIEGFDPDVWMADMDD